MLKIVEYLDVDIVSRAIEGDQLTQSVVIVVLVGQFQNWLVHHLAEPDNGATDQLAGPLAVGHQPRAADTCQRGSCCQVHIDLGLSVRLQN